MFYSNLNQFKQNTPFIKWHFEHNAPKKLQIDNNVVKQFQSINWRSVNKTGNESAPLFFTVHCLYWILTVAT